MLEFIGVISIGACAVALVYGAILFFVSFLCASEEIKRLAKRVDELEAEIEETDRVAELNNGVIDETVDELEALDERLAVLEAKSTDKAAK